MFAPTPDHPIVAIRPADNDDGSLTVAEASLPQLVFAIRCKLEREPSHRRPLMSALVLSALAYATHKEAGHA